MADKPSSSFFRKCLALLSWASVLALWGCVACTWVHPGFFRFIGVVGLAFPFFLGGVLFMLLLCLLFFPRISWIPILGILLSLFPIRHYCPVNLPSRAPEGSLKIMSYNTMGFGNKVKDADGHNAVAAYIAKSDADIVCYQEGYFFTFPQFEKDIKELSGGRLAYIDTIRNADHTIGCISRYPIIKKTNISPYIETGCGEFQILLGEGDTLRVVNCHLKSMGLSTHDRNRYQKMLMNPDSADVESSSRMLISKISVASVKRANEADTLVKYLQAHQGQSIIVCGDFNDSPISYTHQQLTSNGLTNAHTASGNGIQRTFNRDAIYVRIDHILCSGDWTPYDCQVDQKMDGSDHYPITCYLKRE